MAAVLPVLNAATTLIGLLLTATSAAQQYAGVLQKAQAEGRDVTVDDLKSLRATDGTVDAALEAAIVAHGG